MHITPHQNSMSDTRILPTYDEEARKRTSAGLLSGLTRAYSKERPPRGTIERDTASFLRSRGMDHLATTSACNEIDEFLSHPTHTIDSDTCSEDDSLVAVAIASLYVAGRLFIDSAGILVAPQEYPRSCLTCLTRVSHFDTGDTVFCSNICRRIAKNSRRLLMLNSLIPASSTFSVDGVLDRDADMISATSQGMLALANDGHIPQIDVLDSLWPFATNEPALDVDLYATDEQCAGGAILEAGRLVPLVHCEQITTGVRWFSTVATDTGVHAHIEAEAPEQHSVYEEDTASVTSMSHGPNMWDTHTLEKLFGFHVGISLAGVLFNSRSIDILKSPYVKLAPHLDHSAPMGTFERALAWQETVEGGGCSRAGCTRCITLPGTLGNEKLATKHVVVWAYERMLSFRAAALLGKDTCAMAARLYHLGGAAREMDTDPSMLGMTVVASVAHNANGHLSKLSSSVLGRTVHDIETGEEYKTGKDRLLALHAFVRTASGCRGYWQLPISMGAEMDAASSNTPQCNVPFHEPMVTITTRILAEVAYDAHTDKKTASSINDVVAEGIATLVVDLMVAPEADQWAHTQQWMCYHERKVYRGVDAEAVVTKASKNGKAWKMGRIGIRHAVRLFELATMYRAFVEAIVVLDVFAHTTTMVHQSACLATMATNGGHVVYTKELMYEKALIDMKAASSHVKPEGVDFEAERKRDIDIVTRLAIAAKTKATAEDTVTHTLIPLAYNLCSLVRMRAKLMHAASCVARCIRTEYAPGIGFWNKISDIGPDHSARKVFAFEHVPAHCMDKVAKMTSRLWFKMGRTMLYTQWMMQTSPLSCGILEKYSPFIIMHNAARTYGSPPLALCAAEALSFPQRYTEFARSTAIIAWSELAARGKRSVPNYSHAATFATASDWPRLYMWPAAVDILADLCYRMTYMRRAACESRPGIRMSKAMDNLSPGRIAALIVDRAIAEASYASGPMPDRLKTRPMIAEATFGERIGDDRCTNDEQIAFGIKYLLEDQPLRTHLPTIEQVVRVVQSGDTTYTCAGEQYMFGKTELPAVRIHVDVAGGTKEAKVGTDGDEEDAAAEPDLEWLDEPTKGEGRRKRRKERRKRNKKRTDGRTKSAPSESNLSEAQKATDNTSSESERVLASTCKQIELETKLPAKEKLQLAYAEEEGMRDELLATSTEELIAEIEGIAGFMASGAREIDNWTSEIRRMYLVRVIHLLKTRETEFKCCFGMSETVFRVCAMGIIGGAFGPAVSPQARRRLRHHGVL